MQMKITGISLLAALVLVLPEVGEAFTSKRGARVNPVNSAIFEVVPRSSGDGSVYWCSAADYAHRQLGAPWQAQVYIARGRAQSVTTGRRSSVQFTLDPAAAGVTPSSSSLSINSLKAGDNMSVQQAMSYCQRSPNF